MLLLFAILLFFSFKEYFSKETAINPIEELGNNSFYQPLPEKYLKVLSKNPIDSVLALNQEIRNYKKQIKFDAHSVSGNLYRELVLIRKVGADDTLETKTIKFNLYPVHQEFTKGNFETVQSNVIKYFYKGSNYEMVRQVLPNIAISKIICYTQYWQSLIDKVDNEMISSKDSEHIVKAIQKGKDSLAVGLNSETSAFGFLFRKELEDSGIPFLPLETTLKKEDVLTTSVVFKNSLAKNQLQVLYIPNDISFWRILTYEKKIPKMNFLNIDKETIQNKLNVYLDSSTSLSNVFDLDKLADYYALLNLYSNRFENSLYLNLNVQTDLLEPYFVDKKLGEHNTYINNLNINDAEFLEKYSLALQKFSTLENTKKHMSKSVDLLRKTLEAQQHISPIDLFDGTLFEHNKLIIAKALKPSSITKIALATYDENHIEVEVENLTNFPIEIAELSFRQKKFITVPTEEGIVVMPTEKRKVTFDLPDSFDNLFVQKKKKTTGFIFEKDIFDLFVGFRLVGTTGTEYNAITPFADFDELTKDDDLFRSEENLSEFDFITVDEVKKTITFTSEAIILDKPLMFPAGYMVNANSGLQIDIMAGGKIISKSPLNFIGTEEKPIRIYSSDKMGQGLLVVNAKEISELEYVEFDNLTNQTHGLWDISGAVVFYESPVNLNHVLIANNSCEDGLNIIRTHFTMSNTTFRNTQSDAFDGDFVQGTLTNCTFENLGNDAIDVSGSSLKMYDLSIINAGDKALSAGENSQMNAERITIDQCEIAIAGKDLSIVHVNDAKISNSKLGFTAFQKKPEFGASSIEAKNVVMNQVETSHLIENKSSLLLNGEQVETIAQVKEQMYGVEFGVDSKETRVKKVQ